MEWKQKSLTEGKWKVDKFVAINQCTQTTNGQKKNHKRYRIILRDKEKKKTAYENLWDAKKAVLSRKFISVNAYIKKEKYLK